MKGAAASGRPVRVVLTRESEDNRPLEALLEADGLEVVDYPCIAVRLLEPPASVIRALGGGEFSALVFTSRRGVAALLGALGRAGGIRLDEPLVAAVGKATAESLAALGVRVDLVAPEQTGESLARSLLQHLKPGDRVLAVRGDLTTGTVRQMLEAGGMIVEEAVVYENAVPDLAPLPADARYVVVCASPSAAERFVEANPHLRESPFVAIGPVTARRMRELGIESPVVAGAPDPASMRDGVRRALEL
jgi:uroporphyrinogen-III synthase